MGANVPPTHQELVEIFAWERPIIDQILSITPQENTERVRYMTESIGWYLAAEYVQKAFMQCIQTLQ
uniref:Uncharacterized protein n=1 Tax=Oryza brachyantha TaxID=4533 RepID=J3M7E2_ORYBR